MDREFKNLVLGCQNCKKDFVIESEDFKFYERIKVPVPKWCKECRQMRRMSFRNERILYKRKCDKTGKDIISIYSSDSPFKIYDRLYWDNGDFDLLKYGRDFDFSRTFFDQFRELMLDVPYPALRVGSSENCEYNNDMSRSKDCYLCSRTHFSENMLYTYRGNRSRNCVDCYQVFKASDHLYECVECISCSNSSYLYFCESCSGSNMLWNCKNCLDCFMCSNLRNKQNCFKNEQFSREEYKKKISEFQLGSFLEKEKILKEFKEINIKSIRKYLSIMNSQNSTGDSILNSKNSRSCFNIKSCENVAYLWDIMDYKDSMDAYSGGRNSELIYECTATAGAYNCYFCRGASDSSDIFYSVSVKNSKNLFGCINLDNKEYCIFNKQYSPEEYKSLIEKIINYMRKTGEWGEFFPLELAMFPYNDTIAQEFFPMTKEEALKKGLSWSNPDTKNYSITIKPEELPDNVKDVENDLLKEVIGCEHAGKCAHGCTTAFKLISRELEFYRQMNLPVPHLCPNCRHYERFNKLNPLKLWSRKCQCGGVKSENGVYKNLAKHHLHGGKPCEEEFETSYSPDRSEIIYCEKCYQQEVY